jgi:type II secretory pathway component PulF
MNNIKSFLKHFNAKKSSGIKISSKDKINLLEQLSNLLNSGIPLLNAFKIIKYQTRDKKLIMLIEVFID